MIEIYSHHKTDLIVQFYNIMSNVIIHLCCMDGIIPK